MFQTDLKELHKHDIESKDFEALPADIKHEILTELKDAGRKIDWAGINSMPKVTSWCHLSSTILFQNTWRKNQENWITQAHLEAGC